METVRARARVTLPTLASETPLAAIEHANSNLAQLNGIVMSALDAIISVDAAQRIILFNPASEKMFGWSAAEMLGQPLDRLIPPHAQDAHHTHIRRFGETGITTRAIGKLGFVTARHKDGSEFPVEASTSQVEVANSKIFTVILRDLTKQHAAQYALEQSEHRFRALVENSFDAIALFATDGTILYGSPSTPQILGYGLDEFVSLNAFDLVHPEDRDTLASRVTLLLEQPQLPASIFLRVLHKNGTWRLMDAVLSNMLANPAVAAIVSNYHDVTERKQIEDAMRASETRLAGIIESATDAIISTDRNFVIESWNHAAESIYGWRADEVIGTSAETLFQTQYVDGGREQLLAEMHDKGVWQGEVSQKRQDGTRVMIYASVTFLQDNETESAGIVAVNRDITALKQAEAELRRSEQVLKLFVEHAPAAIAMFDRNMNFMAVSRRYLSDHDLGDQSLVGRWDYEVFPEIPERWREIHRRCLAGETAHADEDTFQRADGSVEDIRWEIRPWHEASGEIGGIILFSEVITDRKQAAQEIKQSAARAQAMSWFSNALTSVSPDLQAVLDITVNRIGKLMGDLCSIALVSEDGEWVDTVAMYHSDPQILASMQEINKKERARVGEMFLGAVVATAKPLLIPVLDQTVLGADTLPQRQHFFKTYPLSSVLIVPLFVQGAVIGSLGVGRTMPNEPYTKDDEAFLEELGGRVALAIANARLFQRLEIELDGRIKVEQALHQLNELLEERVAERTTQLEKANKELEAFSYSVSHDLRAPLRAIDGFAHILLRDNVTGLNPKMQRYLGVIRDNTQQMGHLIDDLLSFSRLNRHTIEMKSIEMAQIIRQVLMEYSSEIEERQVELTIGDLGTSQGDAALLKQVWVNLISNAFKYSRSRTPTKIEITRTEQNGESVYSIKDNGVGFDMTYVDKLFGVFQRLHRAEDYEGTGVGLAIVQRIVHRHGGRVWAEGQVDVGATFYFTLGSEPEDTRTS